MKQGILLEFYNDSFQMMPFSCKQRLVWFPMLLITSMRKSWPECFWFLPRFLSWVRAKFVDCSDTSYNTAFRLVIKLLVNKPCYWLKWIRWFILANSRDGLLQVDYSSRLLDQKSIKFNYKSKGSIETTQKEHPTGEIHWI